MDDRCDLCRKKIRFIKRKNQKALIVDHSPIYFIPSESDEAELFLMTNGKYRKGIRSSDGLKGFILHVC